MSERSAELIKHELTASTPLGCWLRLARISPNESSGLSKVMLHRQNSTRRQTLTGRAAHLDSCHPTCVLVATVNGKEIKMKFVNGQESSLKAQKNVSCKNEFSTRDSRGIMRSRHFWCANKSEFASQFWSSCEGSGNKEIGKKANSFPAFFSRRLTLNFQQLSCCSWCCVTRSIKQKAISKTFKSPD